MMPRPRRKELIEMDGDEQRTIEESAENASLLLRDRALYGTSFVDKTGRRINPATLEPWCSMDPPKTAA